MSFIMLVTKPKYSEERTLEVLNKHFQANLSEKHPRAMISLFFDDSYKKVMGKHINAEKIGKRKQQAIYEEMSRRLREKYGPWVTITHFKCKHPWEIRFECNLDRVYSTPNGRLYGSPLYSFFQDVYFTSHCFERFDERCPVGYKVLIRPEMLRKLKAEPSAADYIITSLNRSPFEYAIEGNGDYHLNILCGDLVLARYDEFFIARTFLHSKMIDKGMKWFKPELSKQEDYELFQTSNGLGPILDRKAIGVDRPNFKIEKLTIEMEDKILAAMKDEQ